MAKDALDEDTLDDTDTQKDNLIELTDEEAEQIQDFLWNPIEGKGKRDYLERLLPELSKEDMEAAILYIYRCKFCRRYFPTWWISKEDWRASPFGELERICALDENVEEFKDAAGGNWGLQICKDCYESYDPTPKYFTIDEYIKMRLVAEGGLEEKNIGERGRILKIIWDLPPSE